MRTANFKLVFVFVLVLFVGASALGQSPQGAPSDPYAVAIIDRAITAMGGAQAWKAIGTARLEGTMRAEGAEALRFAAQGDWSTGKFQSSHELKDSQGLHVDTFDPDKVGPNRSGGESQNLPRDPGSDVHSAYLPGAHLSLIRNSSQFRVSPSPHPDWRPAGEREVQVFRTDLKYAYRPVQVWTFSAETGLPLRARIAIPGRFGVPLYKVVTFNGFQTASGLVLPKTIDIAYPDDVKQTVTFEKINLGASSTGSNSNLAR